ncbi:SDR family oxidoreductase [Inquilinus sp. CAU 1745]|uniref:SDR family NAD(P)-dependent oxidoreductase n=1 Tax=Inquilinus sp. CAU 1745 TaxID=3140369 RepID=UPI00325B4A44
MTDLTGKTVLIVGGSRGIGAAAARRFAEAGAAVAVAARSAEACESVADAIGSAGGRSLAVTCDITKYREVEALIARAVDAFGGIDILVNNAGAIEPIGLLTKADPEDWARSIAINLTGAFNVLRAAVPAMMERPRPVVINVSSGAASTPREGWSAYCAGKAGLAMLTRSLALETEGSGLVVFGFRPGIVDTDMQVAIRASGMNPVSRIPRRDLLPVDDPARFLVWLAGGEADDLAGQEVDIRAPGLRERAGLDPRP